MNFYAIIPAAALSTLTGQGGESMAGRLVRSAPLAEDPQDPLRVEVAITAPAEHVDWEKFRAYPMDLLAGFNYYRLPATALAGAKIAPVKYAA